LAIEITYSHKTSDNKKQNLLNADIDTIEIRLDKYNLPNIEMLIELRSVKYWGAILDAFRSCIHYELPSRWLDAKTALVKANQYTELKKELDIKKQQIRKLVNEKKHLKNLLDVELSAHRERHNRFEKHFGPTFSRIDELEQRLLVAENTICQLRHELQVTTENFEYLNCVFSSEFPEANVSDLIEEQRQINMIKQIKQ